MIQSPDGLDLLFLAFFFRDSIESTLGALDGSGGCWFFPLQRMELINCRGFHWCSTVIVTHVACLLVMILCLDFRQRFPSGTPGSVAGEAKLSIPIRCLAVHLLLLLMRSAKRRSFKILCYDWISNTPCRRKFRAEETTGQDKNEKENIEMLKISWQGWGWWQRNFLKQTKEGKLSLTYRR